MGVTTEYIKQCTAEKKCFACGKGFSDENVFTALGWEETKISGMCELCFDKCFEDEEDE